MLSRLRNEKRHHVSCNDHARASEHYELSRDEICTSILTSKLILIVNIAGHYYLWQMLILTPSLQEVVTNKNKKGLKERRKDIS